MDKVGSPFSADIEFIKAFLPHRPPFLLIDRVEQIEIKDTPDSDWRATDRTGIKVRARKCISYNEPYFVGHFPSFAIMPGVLAIEALAQAASFTYYPYVFSKLGTPAAEFQCILAGVNKCRFRRPIIPGDVLLLETEVVKNRGEFFVFDCKASVEGQVAAEAEIWANLIPSGK